MACWRALSSRAAALGQPGWEAHSSAAEYPIATADGGLTMVNDEVTGVGILRLAAPGATSSWT